MYEISHLGKSFVSHIYLRLRLLIASDGWFKEGSGYGYAFGS